MKKVIIDSREQKRIPIAKQFFQDNGYEVSVQELSTGDYLFNDKTLNEIDGETYKIDNGITTIRTGSRINDLDVNFYDESMVIMTNDNLVSINNGNVNYVLTDNYKNNGGELTKRVYQSNKDIYKFIIFQNNEKKNCYASSNDEINYKIYTISYNEENHTFENVKEIVSRTKNDGCDKYKEDLEELTN